MSNFNFNKTFLGGRLTTSPELKQTSTGISVCSFTIAVNRKTGKDKEQQTDFIFCKAWRNTAEFICKYFSKGSPICIVGNIQTRSWTDNEGNKRSAMDVVVDEAVFVDGKNDGEQGQAYSYSPSPAPNFEEVKDDADLPF